MRRFTINRARPAVMAGLWLILWQIAAGLVGEALIVPGPWTVLVHAARILTDPENLRIILRSGGKILGGILLALAGGILAASLSVRRRLLREFLAPLFVAVKSVPVASVVILLLLWQGAERLSVWVAFLIAWPVFYEYLLLGLTLRDRSRQEMLRVFGVSQPQQLYYHTLPAVFPQLCSSLSLSVGMSWKAGVAAEVIATPLRSIGNELYRAKILLETPDVFAWTLIIIALGYGSERILGKLLQGILPKGVRL